MTPYLVHNAAHLNSLHASGKVIAFEPQPAVAKKLYARLHARRNVHFLAPIPGTVPSMDRLAEVASTFSTDSPGGLLIINGAASDVVGTMPIYRSSEASGTKMMSLAPGE